MEKIKKEVKTEEITQVVISEEELVDVLAKSAAKVLDAADMPLVMSRFAMTTMAAITVEAANRLFREDRADEGESN